MGLVIAPWSIDVKVVVFVVPKLRDNFTIRLLPSSNTVVDSGIRGWRKTHFQLTSVLESHWWYLCHESVKVWDSTIWFTIWQFRTPAQKHYLQIHLLAERFVLGGGELSGFSKRGTQGLSNGTNLASQQTFFFFFVFASIVYGLSVRLIGSYAQAKSSERWQKLQNASFRFE